MKLKFLYWGKHVVKETFSANEMIHFIQSELLSESGSFYGGFPISLQSNPDETIYSDETIFERGKIVDASVASQTAIGVLEGL